MAILERVSLAGDGNSDHVRRFRRRLGNPFYGQELAWYMKRGGHHGLRVVLGLVCTTVAVGAPLALGPGSDMAMRLGAGFPVAYFAAAVLFLALVAGLLPGGSLAREREAGVLELFLLAGRRPWEILLGKLAACAVAGGTLILQCLAAAILLHLLYRVSAPLLVGWMACGLLLTVLVGEIVCCYESLLETTRPSRHLWRLPLAVGAAVAGGLAAREAAWPVPGQLVVGAACLAAGIFWVSCRALGSLAPLRDERDEDEAAPRRRLSSRTLTGRQVARPVFEASRIPTHVPWSRIAGLTGLTLAALLRIGSFTHPSLNLALYATLALYGPVMALLLASESLAISPSSSGFSVLAATPLSSRRVILQRSAGKLSLAFWAPAPYLLLAGQPRLWTPAAAESLGLVVAFSLLVFTSTLAGRARGDMSAWALLDLAWGVLLMAVGLDTLRRFVEAWVPSMGSTSSPVSTLPLALACVLAAAGAWSMAVHRFERARRSVG